MPNKHTHRYSMDGLVYAPVELGTIRLGRMESPEDGPDRPVATDYFRVTKLVKRDGDWVDHELQELLLKRQKPDDSDDQVESAANRKLRAIPIRLQFNAPDLVIRSNLQAFDLNSKRLVCASSGNGLAKRAEADGSVNEVECIGNDTCEFAARQGIRCKFFGRLHVQIDGQAHPDNGFVLRTSSFNSLTNVEAQLARYHAAFGGRLTGVPFVLRLRSRATSKSFWRPFYFVDVELPEGMDMAGAMKLALDHEKMQEDAQLDIAALEAIARRGVANGRLFDNHLEDELCEEFYDPAPAPDEPALASAGEGEGATQARRAAGIVIQNFRLPAKGEGASSTTEPPPQPAAATAEASPGASAPPPAPTVPKAVEVSPTKAALAPVVKPAPASAPAPMAKPTPRPGIVDF